MRRILSVPGRRARGSISRSASRGYAASSGGSPGIGWPSQVIPSAIATNSCSRSCRLSRSGAAEGEEGVELAASRRASRVGAVDRRQVVDGRRRPPAAARGRSARRRRSRAAPRAGRHRAAASRSRREQAPLQLLRAHQQHAVGRPRVALDHHQPVVGLDEVERHLPVPAELRARAARRSAGCPRVDREELDPGRVLPLARRPVGHVRGDLAAGGARSRCSASARRRTPARATGSPRWDGSRSSFRCPASGPVLVSSPTPPREKAARAK